MASSLVLAFRGKERLFYDEEEGALIQRPSGHHRPPMKGGSDEANGQRKREKVEQRGAVCLGFRDGSFEREEHNGGRESDSPLMNGRKQIER